MINTTSNTAKNGGPKAISGTPSNQDGGGMLSIAGIGVNGAVGNQGGT